METAKTGQPPDILSEHIEKTGDQALAMESVIPFLERLDGLMSATNDMRISALHNVLPGLNRVREGLAEERKEQETGFRNFEMAEDLHSLEKLIQEQENEFDALDSIGRWRLGEGRDLWGWEKYHSNVLAWLLDPRQSHGLGDGFLNRFLLRAGVATAGQFLNWSETEVTPEWEHFVDGQQGFLDILIVSESEQFLCAIENKVFSSEHSEQLSRYRKALDSSYPNFTKHHLFLTRWGTLPSREEETEYWKPLTYSKVYEVLQQITENNDHSANKGVRAFLRQYATTVRRNIMPENSVSELARKIYLEHRKAVDEIYARKPDWVSEAKQWIKVAVARQKGWTLDVESATYVRFRSADWDQYKVTQTGSGWAPSSQSLLLFQLRFSNGLPRLDLGLSPGDEADNRLREKLFEAVWQHPKLFKPKSTSLVKGWMILHEEADYILDEADYGVGWDDGATRNKVEKWIERFAENQFPEMNEIIINCLREYEAEQQIA